MDSIIVACTVPVADAIAAGSHRAGRYDHELTEEQCKAILDEGLQRVARAYLASEGAIAAKRLRVATPDWEGVLTSLRSAALLVSTQRRHRPTELEFLAAWAEPGQHARHLANVLPEAELLEVARRVAFMPFERFTKFEKAHRRPQNVPHGPGCLVPTWDRDRQEESIERQVIEEEAKLDADQWQVFKAITSAINNRNQDASGTPGLGQYDAVLRNHSLTCRGCRGTHECATLLISVTWCGRTLSREYLLKR